MNKYFSCVCRLKAQPFVNFALGVIYLPLEEVGGFWGRVILRDGCRLVHNVCQLNCYMVYFTLFCGFSTHIKSLQEFQFESGCYKLSLDKIFALKLWEFRKISFSEYFLLSQKNRWNEEIRRKIRKVRGWKNRKVVSALKQSISFSSWPSIGSSLSCNTICLWGWLWQSVGVVFLKIDTHTNNRTSFNVSSCPSLRRL